MLLLFGCLESGLSVAEEVEDLRSQLGGHEKEILLNLVEQKSLSAHCCGQ